MKNDILLSIITLSFFSCSIYSQISESIMPENKISSIQTPLKTKFDSKYTAPRKIIGYKVVEKVNMNFGGHTLTYTVSKKSLIRTNNLGPGNTRVVTPIYASKEQSLNFTPAVPTFNTKIGNTQKKLRPVKEINEIDRLKKEGNKYYFDGKLDMSAQIYKRLFALTSDLETEYYFRYALSLKYVEEIDKANEMMKIYNKKVWEKFSQKRY